MDFNVRTGVVREHQLFTLPQFAEELERSSKEVKEAGVFKMVLDDSCRGLGTALQDFLDMGGGRLAAARKMFPVKFPQNPLLYGHRAVSLEDEDSDSTSASAYCSREDMDSFLEEALKVESYSNSDSCCIKTLNGANGEEHILSHFFDNVLNELSSESCGYQKPISEKKILEEGKRIKKNYDKFFKNFYSMPSTLRRETIEHCLKKDKRPINSGCSCNDCCEDSQSDQNSSGRGVMYGNGIVLSDSDKVRITPNFGLYAVCEASILRIVPFHYEGITRPFLYVGTRHSFFPVHIEDMSLYSVNYLHYGHPKIWVIVPPHAVSKLDYCLATSGVNTGHVSCRNVLGHKYHIPTPAWLKSREIPFKVVIQRAGEAVVVCPNASHFGFNTGNNISEACNFGNRSWIPYGMVAPKCICMGGEVHLNMDLIVGAFRPSLLSSYRSQEIPLVDDDPNFARSILWSKATGHTPPKKNTDGEHETASAEENDAEESQDIFPQPPTKRKGRKFVACPKMTCGKKFVGGQKSRLIKHVMNSHAKDPQLSHLKKCLEEMFPPRDKTPRKKCKKCGKLIAGRASQMRAHHQSQGCIRAPHK